MTATPYAQLGLTVLAALCLTACTANTEAAPTGTSSSPATSASSTPAPTTTTTPSAAPTEVAPSDAEITADASAEAATVSLATSAVTAFCRPTLDYDTWTAELYPFLSQQAAVAYETVDPANVPCTTLTGAARVRDGDGAYTMRILVPTDAGEYSVYVHRTVETGPWAVEQITPLASE
ncbi:hypothetical protein GSU68_19200 (plasmid) [Rathayibacter sp. VKM Ac-2759]|uniref:hypothetical protein n=1 Tax=Rathayibacter sp. VKM Ac-2759 TaxID=2609252 RepID=UPI0013189A5F|nr:hypothetical protein [Rathayibacter sp. VKM Ac-2759]QHC68846.1 hypothetical protein GSU68_19200 [Rathayibacter sp. VKM Ac-2759]